MTETYVTLVSVPDAARGERIARALVDRRHAACVQILPAMTSFYVWEGKNMQAAELLIIIKSTSERLADIEATDTELNYYEDPEIVHLRIEGGYPPYLDWLPAGIPCLGVS